MRADSCPGFEGQNMENVKVGEDASMSRPRGPIYSRGKGTSKYTALSPNGHPQPRAEFLGCPWKAKQSIIFGGPSWGGQRLFKEPISPRSISGMRWGVDGRQGQAGSNILGRV